MSAAAWLSSALCMCTRPSAVQNHVNSSMRSRLQCWPGAVACGDDSPSARACHVCTSACSVQIWQICTTASHDGLVAGAPAHMPAPAVACARSQGAEHHGRQPAPSPGSWLPQRQCNSVCHEGLLALLTHLGTGWRTPATCGFQGLHLYMPGCGTALLASVTPVLHARLWNAGIKAASHQPFGVHMAHVAKAMACTCRRAMA